METVNQVKRRGSDRVMGAVGLLATFFVLALPAIPAPKRPMDSPLPQLEWGEPFLYHCAGGGKLGVRYGRLSDGSLSLARLDLPDHRTVTLPQLVAGSGARYSNDLRWQWWSKGSSGFLERRDHQGQWQKFLDQCRS